MKAGRTQWTPQEGKLRRLQTAQPPSCAVSPQMGQGRAGQGRARLLCIDVCMPSCRLTSSRRSATICSTRAFITAAISSADPAVWVGGGGQPESENECQAGPYRQEGAGAGSGQAGPRWQEPVQGQGGPCVPHASMHARTAMEPSSSSPSLNIMWCSMDTPVVNPTSGPAASAVQQRDGGHLVAVGERGGAEAQQPPESGPHCVDLLTHAARRGRRSR